MNKIFIVYLDYFFVDIMDKILSLYFGLNKEKMKRKSHYLLTSMSTF